MFFEDFADLPSPEESPEFLEYTMQADYERELAEVIELYSLCRRLATRERQYFLREMRARVQSRAEFDAFF